jgi:hypothetical protein
MVKVCTVPIEKRLELCPDPKIFDACMKDLFLCVSQEEVEETFRKWNSLCEELKCPYLKEASKSRVYIKGMGLFETYDGIHYYKVKTEDKTEQTTIEKYLSTKAKP